jgi:hypothetical protein
VRRDINEKSYFRRCGPRRSAASRIEKGLPVAEVGSVHPLTGVTRRTGPRENVSASQPGKFAFHLVGWGSSPRVHAVTLEVIATMSDNFAVNLAALAN